MNELLTLSQEYGWVLVVALYALLNPDKIARIFSPIFPPIFRWLEARREREIEEKRDHEQLLTAQYESVFEIVKETIQWMRKDFTELNGRLEAVVIQVRELRSAIDRNNMLLTSFNASLTELSDQVQSNKKK